MNVRQGVRLHLLREEELLHSLPAGSTVSRSPSSAPVFVVLVQASAAGRSLSAALSRTTHALDALCPQRVERPDATPTSLPYVERPFRFHLAARSMCAGRASVPLDSSYGIGSHGSEEIGCEDSGIARGRRPRLARGGRRSQGLRATRSGYRSPDFELEGRDSVRSTEGTGALSEFPGQDGGARLLLPGADPWVNDSDGSVP